MPNFFRQVVRQIGVHFAAGRLAGTFGCVGAGCVGAGLGGHGLYGVGTHGWGGTYGAGAGAGLKQQLGAQLDTHEVEQIGGQDLFLWEAERHCL